MEEAMQRQVEHIKAEIAMMYSMPQTKTNDKIRELRIKLAQLQEMLKEELDN